MFEAKETATIYEYGNQYWIIEESSQQWPDRDGPVEKVALAGALPVGAEPVELGKFGLLALDNFNKKQPEFKPWEIKESRKQICSWVGAKGWPSFYKNSRYVWLARGSSENQVKIIPVDNCLAGSSESAVVDRIIELKGEIDPEKLGISIVEAFKYATAHPERKG